MRIELICERSCRALEWRSWARMIQEGGIDYVPSRGSVGVDAGLIER